ncbi:MAG: hypothetical protein WAO69_16170 [Aestuariivita sp.]|uniref:hypothetical protein n=1 Tax=Aestuariivita sp. TaxID=1872407 RepID=UPI003BAE4620
MKHLLHAALLGLSLSATPLSAEVLRVAPFDQAQQQPGFVAYRDAFLKAVLARDIPAMLDFVSPDVELSFGGDAGHEAFVRFLTVPSELLSPEYRDQAGEMRAEYWGALETVLRGGGAFQDDGTFYAPYTAAVDLPEQFTPYDTFFVIGTDVPLRARPNGLSKIVARMDHEVLLAVYQENEPKRFRKVERGNGQEGFVRRDQLRSVVDYRALFTRESGTWQMFLFLAGD